jgi:hypothetical protein
MSTERRPKGGAVDQIIEFLTSKTLAEMAADPRVLFGTLVLFVLAVLFRWKFVLLFLVAIGATMTVLKYTGGGGGPSEIIVDRSMMLFIGGTIVIAIVLIYFLFIRD